jgi:ATP-dependent DNA helicase RecG
MTNSSLRTRLGIENENVAQASRLIRDAANVGLIKLYDPDARRKNASYLPFWA